MAGSNSFLASLLDHTAPLAIRRLAAAGSLPLAPGDMLRVLTRLAADADLQVAELANRTVNDLPQGEILVQLQAADCDPDVLRFFSLDNPSSLVIEVIIGNPATPPEIIERMASTVPAHMIDTILDNRVRLLGNPNVLTRLKANPHVSSDALRIIGEIEADFLGSQKSGYVVEQQGPSPVPAEALPMSEEELSFEDFSLEGLPEDPEQREPALLQRLSLMPVPRKVQLAMFGPRELRGILVRDPNREVAKAVLRSPKLTESEVETFASMRSVSEDILRDIAQSREWLRSYKVVHSLVRNPKTPAMASQRMLFRLTSRDLASLTRDRGLPEAVRRNAQRTLDQRNSV